MAERKRITLGLQGGGSHGAFTWGVLETLLADERLEIEGISGTSAGAMNATVMAEGLMQNGRQGALDSLERFWTKVARVGRFAPMIRTPLDIVADRWNMEVQPGYLLFDVFSRFLSPYQFNPLNFNPLQEILDKEVDFELVRSCDQVKLFISATNVATGKIRVFRNAELTPKAVMASACLPHLFQAVEIDGQPYWDGGYMGNPAIFPLIYNCESRDIVIVQINPIERDEEPTTTPEIVDRLNEITFNSTLMREMRAIQFVSRLLASHNVDPSQYKQLLMHRVDIAEEMRDFGAASKMNADWSFLSHLRELGQERGKAWLAAHYDDLNERTSIDLESDYL
ncbi:patatin-like phospholipase family protein [Rhodovibrio salinarum]|uniref:Patatin n=1 Tax=Rhodovibrio salinarum TaxID=1087 RepID=A0A934QKI9_9PROT|nr:patatin-like phospholipase family protein [Rhodovibrio salinarum]MBK1698583.1 patatin [Rhodovibrio salinarum]